MFNFRLNYKARAQENKNSKLQQEFPRANFFTGSTSCSLLYLDALHKAGEERLLLPTQELFSKKGFAVYGGELGNTFSKKSINRRAISGCDVERAGNALNWAKSMAEKRWTVEDAQKKLADLKRKNDNWAQLESSGKQILKEMKDIIRICKLQAQNTKLQLENYEHVNK
ncbi:hypothetical protein ACQUW5_06850 [Legionella sp. CNM-1927-20]|uniref:hypothetical protein n=1 Tax=Legionella sp. CNM-1927-20 TaxID=3422221 RepID=UPI00403AA1E3